MSSESEHVGALPPRHASEAGEPGGKPRNAGVRQAVRNSLRGTISRRFNPVILALAGRRHVRLFAVLYHKGRRSGRDFTTPVTALATSDGFVISLTFGEGADWYRNVRAAGGCVLRWNGSNYTLVDPEVIDWAAAQPAFNAVERLLVPLIGIDQFVRLRHAPGKSGGALAS